MKIRTLGLVGVLASVGLVSGCSTIREANKNIEKDTASAESIFNKSYSKASALSSSNGDVNKVANFGKIKRNWVDPTPLERVEAPKKLPAVFSDKVAMTMPGTVNAVEVLSEMQRSTGIHFKLANDIYDTSTSSGRIVGAGGGGGGAGAGAAGGAGVKEGVPVMVSDFVYRGTLEGALNLLAAKANISWKWNGTAVELYRYETKTYSIAALAGATSSMSNVALSAASAGGGGGKEGGDGPKGEANSTVSRNSTLTTWDDVKAFLLSQMSPKGSMAVLESAGVVTIKDTPDVHRRLAKSVSDLNGLLSKQVFLNVDVYAVSKDQEDDTGLDMNLAWANSRMKFHQLSTGNALGSGTANGTFNIGILSGKLAGSNIMLKALSTLGKASIVNQFSITTLNGQPTPIASNRNVAYIKESKVSVNDNSSSTEIVAGNVSGGINLNVVPKIEPNGNILLEYAMNLSEIEDLVSYTSPDGKSSIQLPIQNVKSLLQRASLRSGETLVLSGFKQQVNTATRSGIGHHNNMLLGGSNKANVKSQYLVLTVTPYVANSNIYNK